MAQSDSTRVTKVAASATSVTVVGGAGDREGLLIFNDSASILRLRFGAADAATDDFSYALAPGDAYEVPSSICLVPVHGIWDSAVGNARVTEFV